MVDLAVLEGKRIVAVGGDLGGWNDTLPVINELIYLGAQVNIYFDPAGAAYQKALRDGLKEGVDFVTRGLYFLQNKPDAILIGVSATAIRSQIAWTRFGRENHIPVFWVEDMWGTGEIREVREKLFPVYGPDIIFTMDNIASDIVSASWPKGVLPVKVGKTTFERLGEVREMRTEVRESVRGQLGVKDNEFLLTWWSGGTSLERVRAQIEAVLQIATDDPEGKFSKIIVAPRFHPKLDRFPCSGELTVTQELFTDFLGFAVDARNFPAEDLILASDVTVADWGGNEGLRSTVLGVPAIVTLFPDDDKEARLARGYNFGFPPLVAACAVLGVESSNELLDAVERMRDHPSWRDSLLERGLPYQAMGVPGATAKIVDKIAEVLATPPKSARSRPIVLFQQRFFFQQKQPRKTRGCFFIPIPNLVWG